MRYSWILFSPLLVAGCATQRPIAVQATQPVVIPVVVPTKHVETRYDVRGYRDAANPSLRHEAHTIYRRTRVPVNAGDELATVSRTTYAPASVAPLPASDELEAELAAQKAITADLRTMQASMAETEQRMHAQYATLVRQSAEALKVREQLEAERSRARGATPPGIAAAPTTAPAGNATEAKW